MTEVRGREGGRAGQRLEVLDYFSINFSPEPYGHSIINARSEVGMHDNIPGSPRVR